MYPKFITLLTGTGIDWRERKLITKLYMNDGDKSTSGPEGDKKCEDWKRS